MLMLRHASVLQLCLPVGESVMMCEDDVYLIGLTCATSFVFTQVWCIIGLFEDINAFCVGSVSHYCSLCLQ